MKLKSLLFGSAAALMAVTGAQAAEPLEPIAEPVDYVRICDAFGTGFFYIPGTDTCLKIGGYVRSDFVYSHDWGDAHIRTRDRTRNPFTGQAGTVAVPPTVTADGRVITPSHVAPDRNFNEFATRARARLNIDTRTQTDIGMVRTYFDLWFTVGPGNTGNFAGTGSLLRQAFIQVANDWGTMTFGRADTFFEFYESSAWATRGIGEDAPLSPVNLAAATFNLGGGVSATIALEDSATDNDRRTGFGGHGFFPVDLNQDGIADTVALGGALGAQPGSIFARAGTLTGIHGGNHAPDVVANLRVDQAWGSAQVMGALHPIRARAFTGPDLAPDQEPDTEFGWAVGAGAGLDIPGTGITFNIQGVYSDGAPGYATDGGAGFLTDGVVTGQFAGFRSLGGGAVTCVAAPGATGPAPCSLISTGIDTTEAWSVKAGLDGNLAPDWVFNLQGFYAEVDTPDVLGAPIARDRHGSTFSVAGPTAVQTTVFHPASGGTPAHLDAGPVISSDFDYWGVSGLVAWTPVSGFITGIELGYEKTEFDAGGDLDRWGGVWRVQKSF